jgi:sialidase-1
VYRRSASPPRDDRPSPGLDASLASPLLSLTRARRIALVLSFALVNTLANAAGVAKTAWIHPQCSPLPLTRFGPFVELEGGKLMAFDGRSVLVSTDEGRIWTPAYQFPRGPQAQKLGTRNALLKLQDGSLLLIAQTTTEWGWDLEEREPKEGSQADLWASRGTDGGKTWTPPRKVFEAGNSEPFSGLETASIIQTRSGHIVLPFQTVLSRPGRWASRSYVSADNGQTWERSNLLDLRGAGNHDGAIEPSVVELSDGRILMLIRSNLDRFWEAFSDDHGRSWRVLQPGSLDASSAPGYFLRLADGRLLLAWNRLGMEGKTEIPRREPKTGVTEPPASWQREELSIAFSKDNAKTWSKPVVIARHKKGLCYPFLLQRPNGDIWLTTRFPSQIAVVFRPENLAGE